VGHHSVGFKHKTPL